MAEANARWRNLRASSFVLLGYLLLTLLFTWPLALHFGDRTPGFMLEDRDQNLWNLWWVSKSLTGLHNPYQSSFIYWPDGVSLLFHTLHPFNGLLAVVLLPLFGVIVTYNLIVVISFVLTGYAVYMLAHYLLQMIKQTAQPSSPTLQVMVAFVAGAAFSFAPFHLSQMRGIMQWVSMEWLPFYLYFLLRALPPLPGPASSPPSQGRNTSALRYGLLAAISLLCTALVDWYQVMYALIFTGLYLLYLLACGRGWLGWWTVLGRAAAVLLPVGVLLLPILVPMLRELQTASYMRPDPDEARRYSADLLSFLLPMRQHPLLGGFSFAVRDKWPLYAATNQYEVYLGFTVLLLAGAGLFVRRARPFNWLLGGLAILCLSLALGPVLQVNGVSIVGLPMPYNLFSKLPFASISRSPDRFSVLVNLSLSLLLALGLWSIVGPLVLNRLRFAYGVCGLALILLVAEFSPAPYPLAAAPVPPWYSTLAKEAGDFAILELPKQDGYWGGGQRMRFQTTHGKRIFGGYISREYYHPFVYQMPGFAQLEGQQPDVYGDDREQQLAALNYYLVRYVVLYAPSDPTEPKQVKGYDPTLYLERIAGLRATAVYTDGWLQAWRVPEVPPQPFVGLGEGWYAVEETAAGPQRWFSDTASLRLVNPSSVAISATLSFSMTALQARELVATLAGAEVYRQQLPASLLPYAIPLRLPPGESELHLSSPSGAAAPGAGDPRPLSFSLLNLRVKEDRLSLHRAAHSPQPTLALSCRFTS